jgi:diacylglycerol kinase (ATP)
VGLDAHIVYHLNLGLKASFGKLAYWISGFKNLGRRLPVFDVSVEGRTVTSGFALASRVRNYGGDLEIASNASLLDHDFEVVLFEGADSFRYLKYLLAAATRRLKGIDGVSILRSRDVEISGSADLRVYVQVDGEFAGHLPARLEIVEKCLTLLVPPKFRKKMLGE